MIAASGSGDSVDVIFDELKRASDATREQLRDLQTQAFFLATGATTVFGLGLARFAVPFDRFREVRVRSDTTALADLGTRVKSFGWVDLLILLGFVAVYLGVVARAAGAFHAGRFLEDVDPAALMKGYTSRPAPATKRALNEVRLIVWEANRDERRVRSKFLYVSQVLLIAEVIYLGGIIVATGLWD